MAPAPGPSLGSTGVMFAGKQSGSELKRGGGSTTGMNITGKRASTPDSLGGSNGYFTQVIYS